LELLGAFKMDLHSSVFRQRENIRDAGARLSWFSALHR